MQQADAVAILAEYGLTLHDITEWTFENAETLHRIARVTIVNRELQSKNGCEPLAWTPPPPPVENADEKKKRESVGLLPAEWSSIKGNYGAMCGIGLSQHAYGQMLRKCRSKKALQLRGDSEKSRLFLLTTLKKIAETAVLRGGNEASDLHMKAKDAIRNAKKLVDKTVKIIN